MLNQKKSNFRRITVIAISFVVLGFGLISSGCTYYQVAPSTVSKFDQSWSAASGAFYDQGVQITNQNRAAGVIQGTINGARVTINLLSQADGGVRVEFDTTGTSSNDRRVIEAIASSYNRRMGR